MSILNFIDRYSSTLSGAYTSGGTTLSVTSAANLPVGTSPAVNFYVIVKAEGANTEEVFLVTDVTGTTLTVAGAQANTSASNHASGATIIGSIMTANAFQHVGPVLLQEKTASASSSLDFTTVITDQFDEYLIEYIQIVPATDGAILKLLLSTDGGATFSTSTYDSAVAQVTTNGASAVNTTGGTTAFILATSFSNVSGHSLSGYGRLYNPRGAAFKQYIGFTLHRLSSGDARVFQENTFGHWATATIVNAFRIIASTGNLTSGNIRVFGIPR